MSTVQQEVDERSNLTTSNKFELLLFRLGGVGPNGPSELYGINVFKIREIVSMPEITPIAGALPHMLGVVNLRGQIIPVIDLPGFIGCTPKSGLNIILVTEFARTTQAFAVEAVEDIVRLEWNQVMSAESSSANGMVTSIARLDGNVDKSRLAQVLDVESIVRKMTPVQANHNDAEKDIKVHIKPGSIILAADDSVVARAMIEEGLKGMGVEYIMVKTGKEAWDQLHVLAKSAQAEGKNIEDKVALVLTDLEMPEMDGFTLTRSIKQSPQFKYLPVVIHSSLSGTTNEEHVRSVGADAYVAKFAVNELSDVIKQVLAR